MTRNSHIATYTETVAIWCKYCGSPDIVKYGFQNDIQQYLCKKCGRKFAEKDTLEGKHYTTKEIGIALSMFFDGLSFNKISDQLQMIYGDNIAPNTIYYWIMEYLPKSIEFLDGYPLKLGDDWVVDETVIDVAGKNTWFWDVIDEDTRFLLASHLSPYRTINDVKMVMTKAWDRSGKPPVSITTDKLPAYPKGIKAVFGDYTEHVKSKGFTADINTNLIERFHGTLKERTKVLRGFKSV
jgi:transposase-like protein